jgi:hypothetical protein
MLCINLQGVEKSLPLGSEGRIHAWFFCGALLARYFQYMWHDEVLDEGAKIS